MTERDNLQQILITSQAILTVLEQQAAGYTSLTIPAHLQVQLDDKRKEVASLEARLAQFDQPKPASVPDFLPRYAGFVGRKAELAQCAAALSPEQRGWGVTIDGIGGMGKTALALEAALQARKAALFDAYLFVSAKTSRLTEDGVRAETLAATSLDAFVRELARQLGRDDVVRLTDAAERRRALLDALRGRRTLSIWDNLETLIKEDRDLIADFLSHLPGESKAIATSRRRTGESAVTIRLDQMSEADAFALMDEMTCTQPRLADELRRAGRGQQRRLYELAGGNPLALKTALGLIAHKGHSLESALARLQNAESDLYAFLFRDAVNSLNDSAKTVLVTFTAFQTPATTNALADASKLTTEQVRVCLEELLGISLVDEGDNNRYGLNPLTRTYVRNALNGPNAPAVAGGAPATLDPAARRTALRYWVDHALKYGGYANDAYQTYPHLDAEWPNLEAAAAELYTISGLPAKLQDAEAARLLNDLCDALSQFLLFRGYWEEEIRLSAWGYEAARACQDDSMAGWRAYEAAMIFYWQAETDQAAHWAERCAEAWGRGGDASDQAEVARLRGLIARQCKEWLEAERLYLEALTAYRKLGEEQDQANVLNSLGGVALSRNDYPRAGRYFQEALALAEKIGDTSGQATYTGNLGLLALDRNLPAQARPWFERSLALARQIGRENLVADAQWGLARVLEEEHRYAEALPLAEKALRIDERLRDQNLGVTRELVARLRQQLGKRAAG
jgi:tetratricopeptide (TPR) repeat protein